MEKAAEKMNTIKTPGVWTPSEYTVRFQTPSGLVDAWSDMGKYCPVCYSVSKDLGVFSRPETTSFKISHDYIAWDVALSDLINSAEANCQFCCFMIDRFFNDPGYTFSFGGDSKTSFACCYLDSHASQSKNVADAVARTRKMCEKYEKPCFRVIAQPDGYSISGSRYERLRFLVYSTNLTTATAVEDILGYRRQIAIEVTAPEGNDVGKYIKARPVNISPGSTESVERLKKWISDCLNNHEACKSIANPLKSNPQSETTQLSMLPTRVIKILGDGDLLLATDTKLGKYTTLSYCWGGSQPFETTRDSLELRKEGFKITQLPKTLQDAVSLMRSLGIEYLWVDSLCIIQDSPEDKDNELPKMPSYYRNTYLTICAGGSSSENGFLVTHKECEQHSGTKIPKDLLCMPYLCPDGATSDIFFREESPYSLSDEPVSRRAWTFQERILSPKIVTYGSRITWQCTTMLETDGGAQDWSFDSRKFSDTEIKQGLISRNKSLATEEATVDITSPTNRTPEEFYSLWYDVVQEFCRRAMTYPEDKLPAIAALAAEFAVTLGDEYVAGLWKKDILRGLMWSTWPHLSVVKPAKWRAPSWSWASIENSAVTYERQPGRTPAVVELSQILDIKIDPKSKTFPFGEVSDAVLEVKGPVIGFDNQTMSEVTRKEYTMPPPEDSTDWRKLMLLVLPGGPSDEKWELPAESVLLVLFAEDAPDNHRPSVDEQVADTNHDPDERTGYLYGLLLAPTGEEGTYERVAAFTKLKMGGYPRMRNFERTIRLV